MTDLEVFTDDLWSSIRPIFKEIIIHPFIKGLTSGSLEVPLFKAYVVQDSLYLHDFSKSLAILSSKAPRKEWKETIESHSKGALEVEKALHESFFRKWKMRGKTLRQLGKNPTNTAYTSYVLASTATLPFNEGLASVLPCYWIYLRVGRHLEQKGSPNPLYKRWIDTYSSEWYAESVHYVLKVMDTLATKMTDADKEKCRKQFRIASIYEYMFWDAAYKSEKWMF